MSRGQAVDDDIPPIQNERRWDRGAWLTLALGLVLLLAPLATSLVAMHYPSDGWESTSVAGFGVPGPYRLLEDVAGQTPELRPEDRVVAINGQPLTADSLPPIPDDLEAGQTLHYTVERDGSRQDVAVRMVEIPPSGLVRSVATNLRENPGNVIFGVALLILATAVFLLRPGSRAARYLFLFATFGQGIGLALYPGLYFASFPPWLNFLNQIYGWGWVYLFMPTIVLIVLVFPIRKRPMRRFPRLTPFMLVGLPLLVAIVANAAVWFGGALPAASLLLPLSFYSAALMLTIVPITLIHNLLTIREPLARAQMRWIALGFGLGLVAPAALLVLNFTVLGSDPRITWLGNVALLFLPAGLAFGILRYRLFDIDVIIRRTTSYAIITLLLALVYFGSVVVFQNLFSQVTGQDSTVAVVLSTLLIAGLFNPVRRRVQDAIDRRFNRTRYDAEKTLERFAATARDETDLDALTAELLAVIEETMQPRTLSLVLFDPGRERPHEGPTIEAVRS